MTDKNSDERSFKVDDRRTSTGNKEDLTQAPGSEDERRAEAEPSNRESEARPSGEGSESTTPQVDFATFLFSLFSSALIQLGDMADPVTGKMEKNLQAAKQTIDILDILAKKTEGNLSDEEDNLLKNASAELKWKYIDTVKDKG
jgi:hypothetical protein